MKAHVKIIDIKKVINTAGDIAVTVLAEIKTDLTVTEERFYADEHKGFHDHAYQALDIDIREWGKKNGAVYYGEIALMNARATPKTTQILVHRCSKECGWYEVDYKNEYFYELRTECENCGASVEDHFDHIELNFNTESVEG